MRRLETLLRGAGARVPAGGHRAVSERAGAQRGAFFGRLASQGPACHPSLRAGAGAQGRARREGVHLSRQADRIGAPRWPAPPPRSHARRMVPPSWTGASPSGPSPRAARAEHRHVHGAAPSPSRVQLAVARAALDRSCRSTARQRQPRAGGQCRPDRAAAPGARVVLDGSGSSDPDRDPLRYNWTLTRPVGSTATLSSATADGADVRPGSPRQLRSAAHRGRRRAAERAGFGGRSPSATRRRWPTPGPDQTAAVASTVDARRQRRQRSRRRRALVSVEPRGPARGQRGGDQRSVRRDAGVSGRPSRHLYRPARGLRRQRLERRGYGDHHDREHRRRWPTPVRIRP